MIFLLYLSVILKPNDPYFTLKNSNKGNYVVMLFCGVLFKQLAEKITVKGKTKDSIHIYPHVHIFTYPLINL